MKMLFLPIIVVLQFVPMERAWADDVSQGERLLQTHCAACHATGKAGESSHTTAPLFRHLSKSYPVEFLAEALAEGIMSGHPDMPVFEFSASQVDQIIAYLKSIQTK